MNTDDVETRWTQLSGELKARWGKLTDGDLGVEHGDAGYLVDRLQQRYGISRTEAENQIGAFDTRNAYPFRPVASLSHLNAQPPRRSGTRV